MNPFDTLRRFMLVMACGLAFCSASSFGQDWPRWRGPNADGISTETGWSSHGKIDDAWRIRVGMGYTSASIWDGKLYTIGFSKETNEDTIACLDAGTGASIWSHSYPAKLMDQDHSGGSLTTPTIEEGNVFVTTREGRLHCLDALTGAMRWSVDVVDSQGVSPNIYGFSGSPLIEGDTVFINMDRTFAYDKANGELRWASEPLSVTYSTPASFMIRGTPCLAVFSQEALVVLDQANGEILYRFPWKFGQRAVSASTPISIGERIFISSAYGHGCALIEFGDDGAAQVWANKRIRNKMAGCVVIDGHIYGFDESILKCLDLEGNEVWRTRGLGNGSLIASDGRLIIMSSKGELIIADATKDAFVELSRTRIFDQGTFWSPPVIADGLIYARSSLGELVCRDHRTTGDDRITTDIAPEALPQAESLFAKHLDLIGGEATLRRHDSRHEEGQFEMRSVGFGVVPFEIDRRAPNFWHSKIQSPGGRPGHIERFFNGKIAYELNPHPAYGNTLMDPDLQRELRHTSDLFDEANFTNKFTSMKTLGIEFFDERECYKVEANTTDGTTRHVYFEVETGLIAGRSGATESIATFNDYREFDGLLIPTLRRYYVQDTGIEETYRVESVSFEAVDESIWELPRSIRELLMAQP
ncbi:MAG: PQQ-binding-like beta-propeller repeat protein [Planctomycetota bacterium]|nr:PQQ-binding-like beta-propeller repeat protein [Planctomycetota bacterium]